MTACYVPTREDKAKLHEEINKLLEQVMVLNTVAVGFFGGVAALIVPTETKGATIVPSILYSFVLLIVLSVLFLIGHQYLRMVRFYASYLRVTRASAWEQHYAEYCNEYNNIHFQYSQVRTILFLTLGFIGVLLPWASHWTATKSMEVSEIELFVVMTCFLISYMAVVARLGFRQGIKIGIDADAKWRRIFDEQVRRSRPLAEQASDAAIARSDPAPLTVKPNL